MAKSQHDRNGYKAAWDKENTLIVRTKLNVRTDADIIEHLDRQYSKSGYIKQLIREDIERGKEE